MFKFLSLLVFFVCSVFAVDANMNIVKQVSKQSSIAVLSSVSSSSSKYSQKLLELVKKDLEVSCNFTFSQPNDLAVSFDSFPIANGLDSNLVLVLDAKQNEQGLEFAFKLYDGNSKTLVLHKKMSTKQVDRYPFLAHKSAILINEYLGAPSIDWMNKLIVFSRYTGAKSSEIVIADYTLTFQLPVVKGGLNLFAKWADDSQQSIYYTSYKDNIPAIYKLDLASKTQEKILQSEGMIVCSDVSADGSNLLLTMAKDSQPEIYKYSILSKALTRLTNYSGIDVSGKFLDGSNKFAYISDRLSKPSIFVQSFDKSAIEKLGNVGSNNSSFSTYKHFVAYSSRESDDRNFNIYLVSAQNGFKQQITDSGKNEFPRFASNGESILFLKGLGGQSMVAIARVLHNKIFTFPSKVGRLQSIDW